MTTVTSVTCCVMLCKVYCLLCVVCSVMLRVVTCCAVPASVFLTVQDSAPASSWYGEGATLWTWLIIAAVSTIVLGGLICLFYRTYLSCRRKHCEQEAVVTCHLCTRRVPASSWRQGRAPRPPAPALPLAGAGTRSQVTVSRGAGVTCDRLVSRGALVQDTDNPAPR